MLWIRLQDSLQCSETEHSLILFMNTWVLATFVVISKLIDKTTIFSWSTLMWNLMLITLNMLCMHSSSMASPLLLITLAASMATYQPQIAPRIPLSSDDGVDLDCQNKTTRGGEYRGRGNVGISGRMCKEWREVGGWTPHSQQYTQLPSNFCRSPSSYPHNRLAFLAHRSQDECVKNVRLRKSYCL